MSSKLPFRDLEVEHVDAELVPGCIPMIVAGIGFFMIVGGFMAYMASQGDFNVTERRLQSAFERGTAFEGRVRAPANGRLLKSPAGGRDTVAYATVLSERVLSSNGRRAVGYREITFTEDSLAFPLETASGTYTVAGPVELAEVHASIYDSPTPPDWALKLVPDLPPLSLPREYSIREHFVLPGEVITVLGILDPARKRITAGEKYQYPQVYTATLASYQEKRGTSAQAPFWIMMAGGALMVPSLFLGFIRASRGGTGRDQTGKRSEP